MAEHPVIWFELMGKDGDNLRGFYERLFEWKIDVDEAMAYGMVEAQEKGIPGGIGQLGEHPQPKVTFYVSTTDIDGSLEKARKLGGTVVTPRTALPGGTILGMFCDPEGNKVGLVEQADS